MEKKYPIGGYAPGNYHDRCCTCRQPFQGDKRSTQCESCAIADKEKFDAMSPEEQQALLTKNAGIANFMLSGPLSPEQELIYRIVEQWGNAVEMPNMVGWLKEYAAQQAPTGAVWVKEALQQSKEAIEFANKEFECPQHFVETWGNMYMNALHAIDQAMDESGDWTSVDEQLPNESGRYWCYVKHLTDIGTSYFQWNCDYNAQLRRFSDMTLTDGEQITHWRILPAAPRVKKQ
jgi:hypothetical protein